MAEKDEPNMNYWPECENTHIDPTYALRSAVHNSSDNSESWQQYLSPLSHEWQPCYL